MKKVFNVDLESHVQHIEKVIEGAFKGLTVEEVKKLNQLYKECEYEYYNRLKLKYILPLGLLSMEYLIPDGVEEYISYRIHTILQQLPTHFEAGDEINIQFS